jgi:hypothetical protein
MRPGSAKRWTATRPLPSWALNHRYEPRSTQPDIVFFSATALPDSI